MDTWQGDASTAPGPSAGRGWPVVRTCSRRRVRLLRSWSRPTLWTVVGWLVLTAGTVGSVVGALSWNAVQHAHNRVVAEGVVSNLTAALRAELQRAGDMTAAVRAEVGLHGGLSSSQLERWEEGLDAQQRYPTSYAMAWLQVVPAARLADYEQRWSDRTGKPASRFLVVPFGRRSHYCFLRVMTVTLPDWYHGPQVNSADAFPPGVDTCGLYPEMDLAGATGSFVTIDISTELLRQVAVLAPTIPNDLLVPKGSALLGIIAPVYRGGAPGAPGPGRARALSGYVLGVFDAGKVLRQALGSQRNVAVTLSRVNPGRPASFVAQAGSSGDGALHRSRSFGADGRWDVAFAVTPDVRDGVIRAQALGIAIGGCALVLLLFGLVRTLKLRERALRLVEQKTDELRHQALHDALTGLPNRALVLDRAEQMLRRVRRDQVPAAALFIDLDGFKNINDTLGHEAGDRLLVAVAARLSGTLRASDTVGRMGGDEFVVLAEGASLTTGPELLAERITEVLREPFHLVEGSRTPYALTASIGIATGDRTDAGELLRDADIALYQAKAAGKDQYVVFETAMHQAVQSRLETEMDLRVALREGHFSLAYQPTFDLSDMSVTGVEALLRWDHPVRGVVPPSGFIPLIEGSGFIVEVGRWVLHEACRQAAAWLADGHPTVVSVNVSARQLEADALVDDVREALLRHGLDPRWLTLEITETALMSDAAAAARRLSALKRLGVGIAVDDFGTGYSSLAYLQQFPVDALKIDRSFVTRLAQSEETRALVRTLVQLGRNLGLSTLAEGIEEQHQLDLLRAEHCDGGQGFLFARPMAAVDVAAFLCRQPAAVTGG